MKLGLRRFLGIVLFIGALAVQSKASHAMGADLTFTHISGNQYRINLSFYRDCSGITPLSSYTITVSSASCGQTLFVTVNQTSFVEVSPLCAAMLPQSTCSGGTLPGVQQYMYEGTVTLPATCSDWVMSYTECCRNSSITTLSSPGSENLYVEARFNNLVSVNNSSPQFTTLPVPYICAGQSYIYNHGAVDPDGDSLVFTLINALNAAGSSVVYNGGFSGAVPMTSAPPVSINSTNGNVTMNPTVPQIAVIAVRVDEYRNGVLIGSTIRDIQVTVLNCTNNSPAINAITSVVNATQTGPFSIEVCPGQSLSFTIPGSDPDGGQTITWSWNNGIPGGVFTGPSGSSPQNATFSWTPTGGDVGFHSLVVQLQDNGCPVIGSQTRAIDITVLQGTTAGPDQVYCVSGGPAQLNALGGTSFTWNILSGTAGSLSCTNCANPQATPTAPTVYEVVSNLPGPCKNRDTIQVTPVPSFSLAMGPDPTICTGGSTSLSATPSPSGAYTYAWSPTTGLSSTTVSNPTASPGTTTSYNVSVTSAAGCVMTGTQTVTVSPAVLSVSPSANPAQSCAGAPVTLTSNAVSGDCNQYTGASIPFAPVAPGGTALALSDDQVSTGIPIGFSFTFFCNTYTTAYVSSNGFITFNAASGSGCCGGQVVPDVLDPNDLIAACWDDLYPPGAGSILHQTLGVAPNRRFVVSYVGIPYCCGTTPAVSSQIILHETSNIIEIHTASVNAASPATQGIENSTGTVAFVVPGRNSTTWSATNEGYRFTPVPPMPFTVNWQEPLGSTFATGTTTNVTPSTTTTYYAVASNGICSATAPVLVDVSRVDAGPDINICPAGQNASLNAVYTGPPAPSNCNAYTVSSIAFAPVAAAGTSVSLGDDQVSAAIPIGFSFTFFCNTYTNLHISSNGFLTFNAASGSGCCGGQLLPNATDPNDVIALAWDDLYPPGAGSILYQTLGVAPNRRFVVTYTGIPFCCGTTPAVTTQAILYETTNVIEIHNTSIAGITPGTQGIENANGSLAFTVAGRNSAAWTATNDAFRFTPQVGTITYSWAPGTYLTSTTIPNPTAVAVGSPITYTVTVNNGTCILTDQINITICFPVDNLQLSAEKETERVKLHWDALNEQNLSHYVIERSGDALLWSDVGMVHAIGQQGATQSYDRYDETPLGGVNYYRLRAVDLDGQVDYSNQVEVFFAGNEWVNVAPNPGRGIFHFEIGKLSEGDLTVEIFNAEGQSVTLLLEKDGPAGVRRLTAHLDDLPAGIYLYRVRTGLQDLSGRLLKLE